MEISGFDSTHNPSIEIQDYGKTLDWYPSDSKENYDPKNNSYGINDITYKINENGFRSDSFDIVSEKRIIFLGCSMTAGIGLPLEHTWPYILLQYIKQDTGYDIPYWNLSQPGGGLDILVRHYYHYGIKLKPQLVFGFFPDYRRELYSYNYGRTILHMANSKEFNFNKMIYMADKRIITYETEKNMCFLDCMLKLNNTEMIWSTWANGYYNVYDKIGLRHTHILRNDNKARDKLHPGHACNIIFAKKIYEDYKDVILAKLKD